MEAGVDELIVRARLICGEQHVLTDPAVLSTYRSDGIRRSGPLPLAAILPGSAPEVVNVVSACADAGVPFVVRGAGTSRTGGSVPRADGLLIVLTRMRRIISRSGSELTAEAGTPLSALPPPPAGLRWLEQPEPLGTLGGYVAEMAGTGNLVGLELVRPDGTRLRLRAGDPGYDITGAFPGSRGRAGVAVTLTLRATRP